MSHLSICDFEGCRLYLENPISFPCGHTVCKDHINENDKTFTCYSCNKCYPIPLEGFGVNVKLSSYINSNLHLNSKHKEVKELLDKLKTAVLNFESSDLAYPDKFLYEYFSNIYNFIDLHREQMIDDINKNYDQVI
jgi:hypothetical protein